MEDAPMTTKETQPPPIVIAAPLIPAADKFLRKHRCTIDVTPGYNGNRNDGTVRTVVTLPPGTERWLMLKAASERHSIRFPDGVIIMQVYDPGTGTSALYIPAQETEEVSDEQQ